MIAAMIDAAGASFKRKSIAAEILKSMPPRSMAALLLPALNCNHARFCLNGRILQPPDPYSMLWRVSRPIRSRSKPPGFILPCQPALAERPPAGPGWLHEIKFDGYR